MPRKVPVRKQTNKISLGTVAQQYRLTPMQAMFIALLRERPDLPKEEICRMIGYKGPVRNMIASPAVRFVLETWRATLETKAKYTSDQILAEIDNIAMSNIADIVDVKDNEVIIKPLSEIPPAAQRTIKAIEAREIESQTKDGPVIKRHVRIEMHPKVPALDLSAQIRGLKPRHEPKEEPTQEEIIVIQLARDTPLPRGPRIAQQSLPKETEGDIIDLKPPKKDTTSGPKKRKTKSS